MASLPSTPLLSLPYQLIQPLFSFLLVQSSFVRKSKTPLTVPSTLKQETHFHHALIPLQIITHTDTHFTVSTSVALYFEGPSTKLSLGEEGLLTQKNVEGLG